MTTTTIASAGYIVHNNEAIWGTGCTAEVAWADFLRAMAAANVAVLTWGEDSADHLGSWTLESDYRIRPASAQLIRSVEDLGGDLTWDIVGGVACTRDEADG